MKKLALLTLVVLVLSSCEINKAPDEVNTFTQTYVVTAKSWIVGSDKSGAYLFYEFREPTLTPYIFENGIMNAYLVMGDAISDGLSPLPFDDFLIGKDNYKWTEQVTCEFRPGFITFILKADDHYNYMGSDPYFPEHKFLVRFMW
ncbi:hypothetical protein FACS1894123_05210 [Bacteroidia bacterium]|nr:hypothetical protein FACS1894123_05210 [Bacteroidia bacterium]